MANGKAGGVVVLVLVLLLGGAIAFLFLHPRTKYADPQPQSGRISPAIDIDVYIDGSGSMKNFLRGPARAGLGQNYFRAFLSNCEETLREAPAVNGWSAKTVRFWKFGSVEGPRQLLGKGDGPDDLHSAALDPEGFFKESNTYIEKAVQHAPPQSPQASELKILVTDLYQSDEKMEHIADDLASRFLVGSKGAVAIYGVRNPYDGPVEDVPGLGKKSLPDAASSMPFYIIVAGDNAADVRHVQEVLESAPGLGPALTGAAKDGRLFATYFSKDPGRFVTAAPTVDAFVSDDGNGRSRRKTATEKAEADYLHSRIEMIHLRSGRVRAVWGNPGTVTDFGLPEEMATQDAQPRKIAWIQPMPGKASGKDLAKAKPAAPAQNGANASSSDGVQKDDRALKAVTFCHAKDPEHPEDSGLCVVIDRSRGLSGGKTYLFQFDQIADSHSGLKRTFDEDQPLMKDWNLNSEETRQLIQEQKFPARPELHGGDRPGKTPSLSQLLKGLQGSVFQIGNEDADPIRVATYYLYVEVK